MGITAFCHDYSVHAAECNCAMSGEVVRDPPSEAVALGANIVTNMSRKAARAAHLHAFHARRRGDAAAESFFRAHRVALRGY